MSLRAFYEEGAEREVQQAIARIEAGSSAEVMVAVRASSGRYTDADCILGFVVAFIGLLVFLFHPAPIRIEIFALEFPLLYGLGMALSAWAPPVRRLLASRERLESSVATAARAAFVELGVSRTRNRTGILVFVSIFERKVVVVADVGVDREQLGEPVAKLESVLSSAPELGKLVAALDGLAAPLARVLPRASDDENELPDVVSAS